MYSYRHERQITTQSIAQLTMAILYSHRFFPYYTHTIIAGLDEEGKGAVYSFDPVGSFERETHRAAGSASALIQPVLDSQVGRKNLTSDTANSLPKLTVESALAICKDAFAAAAERDIYIGDFVDVWILRKDQPVEHIQFPLRCD